ncbi:MAG: hypothetical protein Q8L86_10025 [Vicinamibacterales bacterium]|nr:hypothetical protein [Vicinamibacterales bacterium]
MLYSHHGATPAPVPFRIVLPGGMTRTDPSTFSDEELAAAGYVPVEDPVYDSATQRADWVEGAWVVSDLPPVPAPEPNTKLSHADVLALLTPSEWAEMNRFHPTASGTSPSGTPYSDAQVFWAVSVFNKAAHVDLADPRAQAIFGLLTQKGILTPARATELQSAMAAAAAARTA